MVLSRPPTPCAAARVRDPACSRVPERQAVLIAEGRAGRSSMDGMFDGPPGIGSAGLTPPDATAKPARFGWLIALVVAGCALAGLAAGGALLLSRAAQERG